MSTLVEIIERNQTHILERWSKAAGYARFAHGLTPAELAGAMPSYLEALGRDGSTPAQLSEAQQLVLESHLSQRLRQGANLNEILTELASLVHVVAEQVAVENDPASSLAQLTYLSDGLRLAIEAAARIFNEHMLEDQQDEKHHALRLQRIFGQAELLHPPSLRRRLAQALDVIMEAMSAQTAAIVLDDGSGQQLVMSASSGDAREELEGHVAALDASTLAGMFSSHPGEATSVDDAETTTLRVSDTLRASGIHSLLGLRLSSRPSLHGVMYIGVRERRGFTASEKRRLRALGDTLDTRLEIARLGSALREKTEDARVQAELHDRFVSTLAHDMAGPIVAAQRAALGLLDHAVAGAEPAAAVILDSLAHLEDMIGELVDAQLVRTGHPLPVHLAQCDLGSLALECAKELRASLGNHFKVTGERQVVGIWSPDLLRRALWNLAANAVRYAHPGTPVIIDVSRYESHAVLTVHNQGAVVPPDELANLTRPFSAAHVGQDQPTAWGMGLTLVWGCAEALGGHVEVQSRAGSGTSFRLILPYDARPYSMDELGT
jgi:signal transduction histidine kinase